MDSIKRDYKDMLIVILLIGVLAMTIIYANFTRRLDIVSANEAKFSSSDWDVHFENLVEAPSSNANIISSATIIEGKTVISGLDVSLVKPGDYVKYTVDIYNAGKIDARLNGFTHSSPICSPSSFVCDYITYTFNYTDGSSISPGDILKVGERRNITFIVRLDEALTSMPSQRINVSDLNATFYYVQK